MVLLILGYANGIQMAGNRLLPVNFSIVISGFDTAFQNAFFIVDRINTLAATNGGCYLLSVVIGFVKTLRFDCLNARRR